MKKILCGVYVLSVCLYVISCAQVPKPMSTNPAVVYLNIAGIVETHTADAMSKRVVKSVLTYWRKAASHDDVLLPGALESTRLDSSREFASARFGVGGANAFMRAMNTAKFRKVRDERVELDAGLYYLDSFELEAAGNILLSQAGDYTKRDGWDSARHAPRFIGFRVKGGEDLRLPQMILYTRIADVYEQADMAILLICLPKGMDEEYGDESRFNDVLLGRIQAPQSKIDSMYPTPLDQIPPALSPLESRRAMEAGSTLAPPLVAGTQLATRYISARDCAMLLQPDE